VAYINYHYTVAESRWGLNNFLSNWWRIYNKDPHWAPPYYPLLRQSLDPSKNEHLARLSALIAHSTALPRKISANMDQGEVNLEGISFERPVSAGILLKDPRRLDRTAHLAELHCVNDIESLERFLEYLSDHMASIGCNQLLCPIGISPYIRTGSLESHWNRTPPLYSSYNPPYLPEMLNSTMDKICTFKLYQFNVPKELPPAPGNAAILIPLNPNNLSNKVSELIMALGSDISLNYQSANFPPPDDLEIEFLFRWIKNWPIYGWLAVVEDITVGFVLLQPDLVSKLKQTNGGKSLLWRIWLEFTKRSSTLQGKVVFGGVHPDWRGRGIGRQLIHQTLITAKDQGWRRVSIGPLSNKNGEILEHMGARPLQVYSLYKWMP
jgi:GNAT superfamily N-acetyltransferase